MKLGCKSPYILKLMQLLQFVLQKKTVYIDIYIYIIYLHICLIFIPVGTLQPKSKEVSEHFFLQVLDMFFFFRKSVGSEFWKGFSPRKVQQGSRKSSGGSRNRRSNLCSKHVR